VAVGNLFEHVGAEHLRLSPGPGLAVSNLSLPNRPGQSKGVVEEERPIQHRLYRLREKQGQVEAFQISDELVVDMAPGGTVYGIELLNAQ
jgi:hypothetical protein